MTKLLLKDALLELMEQQKLTDISILAICEMADVHRSTFYKHYRDPDDLLKDIIQDILDRIPEPPQILNRQDEEQLLRQTTAFFEDVKQNKRVYQILFSEQAGDIFPAELMEYLCSGYIPHSDIADETAACFISLYVASGTVCMMREWIKAGFPVSSQKIAEMMYYLSRKIMN
ncbi:MAG: TetR/AcrR family transcriptional regulator [Solobacterium sp.]|nr:TetR/AcrR family transcriptional regulator [Solobacterium sp.]